MWESRKRSKVALGLGTGVLLVGALGLGWAVFLRSPGPPQRLVLIVVDTLRRDHLSVYGSPVPTPHIDALAARGRAYENLLASFHQTSMSMASLFTGRTPSIEGEKPGATLSWNGSTWCGMSRFTGAQEGSCIPGSLPTLAEGLREAGYWTIGVAANPFLFEPSGFGRGFDDWVEVGGRCAPEPAPARGRRRARGLPAWREWRFVQSAAVKAVERRRRDRLFLYVHYMDAHDYGQLGHSYAAGVELADRAVGELLEALDRAALLEDAVVILTADHGERLGDRHALPGRQEHFGNPTFQELLRVPLIVAPAILPERDGLLRSQDLFYLLLELAGVRREPVSPLEPDELLLSERDYRTYLKGRWKIVMRRGDNRTHLFDLDEDPHERRDAVEAHPELVGRYQRRVEELTARLRAKAVARRELTAEERGRLEDLGYLRQGDGG